MAEFRIIVAIFGAGMAVFGGTVAIRSSCGGLLSTHGGLKSRRGGLNSCDGGLFQAGCMFVRRENFPGRGAAELPVDEEVLDVFLKKRTFSFRCGRFGSGSGTFFTKRTFIPALRTSNAALRTSSGEL
ncbi:hypothetical protein [Alkalicoccus urumqiensis]|uniref:hypothetical protein n=1 Tax=Alkalicoccus urumqiensis TaxID=1548213 RepID=UPI0015E5EDC7|nr:hypothetical protein [Alkalicoccus urumqiensis]